MGRGGGGCCVYTRRARGRGPAQRPPSATRVRVVHDVISSSRIRDPNTIVLCIMSAAAGGGSAGRAAIKQEMKSKKKHCTHTAIRCARSACLAASPATHGTGAPAALYRCCYYLLPPGAGAGMDLSPGVDVWLAETLLAHTLLQGMLLLPHVWGHVVEPRAAPCCLVGLPHPGSRVSSSSSSRSRASQLR